MLNLHNLSWTRGRSGMREAAVMAQDTPLVRAKLLAHIDATDPARKAVLAADIARLDHAIDAAMAAIRAGHTNVGHEQLLHRFEHAWDNYLALSASPAHHER